MDERMFLPEISIDSSQHSLFKPDTEQGKVDRT
jgi:hypothetical protein